MYVLELAFILLLATTEVVSYAAGPPNDVCTDAAMAPSHGGTAQSVQLPYNFTISANEYTAGGSLTGNNILL